MSGMDDTHAWTRHDELGAYWQCPVGALPFWSARGWTPCDPPVEPDPTRDPLMIAEPPPVAAAGEPPAGVPVAGTKPTKSGKAGATTEGAE